MAVAYVAGRVVAGTIASLLAGARVKSVLARLGLAQEPAEGKRTPSQLVGLVVLVAITLFATIEAARLLNFALFGQLVAQFTRFAGQTALGLIIFGIGRYLANLASKVVEGTGAAQARWLGLAARVRILVLATAMALRQMGLANEIIKPGFGLLLGAVAVEIAQASGLGGRGIAVREPRSWPESPESRES